MKEYLSFRLFDVKPGEKLYLPPPDGIRIW
jgi:predicted metalloendopeptidase